jgi:hypothetical protein
MSSQDRLAIFTRLQGEHDSRSLHSGRSVGEGGGGVLSTGLEAFDAAFGEGGLPCGAITELVCAGPSCGGQLLLTSLLQATRRVRQRVALIDGCDAFDPQSHDPDICRHMVWVRCSSVAATLQVADLVARDVNFGLVVVDMKHAGERELRRTPSASWYRLQRAVRGTSLVLLVVTPRRTVPSAQVRIALNDAYSLSAFECERTGLAGKLEPVVQRQRVQLLQAEG